MRIDPDYLGPYLRAVDSHGPGFVSLLYGSREHQARRFAALCDSVALDGRCVADLGSGHGDLLEWMIAREVGYARYVGVEAVAAFDRIARERHATRRRPRASFLRADFVEDSALFETLVREHEVDTVILCGSLNTLDETLALDVLERAWTALLGVTSESGAVLAFNFLAGGGDWARPPTNLPRRDTQRWLAWALERTPEIVFRQHYLGAHDATLVMHAPERSVKV